MINKRYVGTWVDEVGTRILIYETGDCFVLHPSGKREQVTKELNLLWMSYIDEHKWTRLCEPYEPIGQAPVVKQDVDNAWNSLMLFSFGVLIGILLGYFLKGAI